MQLTEMDLNQAIAFLISEGFSIHLEKSVGAPTPGLQPGVRISMTISRPDNLYTEICSEHLISQCHEKIVEKAKRLHDIKNSPGLPDKFRVGVAPVLGRRGGSTTTEAKTPKGLKPEYDQP